MASFRFDGAWKASANGFIIGNFDSNFVVVAKLNRGTAELRSPQFFIIPTEPP
jgi:hypothetical protein